MCITQWATDRAFRWPFGRKFRQKFGRNSFCFNLTFRCFCRNSFFRQKGFLSAEIASFGRKFHLICLNSLSKMTIILCRKTIFRQKQPLSAERLSFGSFCISAEMNFFESLSFGFRQKEAISLSVAHCEWLMDRLHSRRNNQQNFLRQLKNNGEWRNEGEPSVETPVRNMYRPTYLCTLRDVSKRK